MQVTNTGASTKVYGIKVIADSDVIRAENDLAFQKEEFHKAMKRLQDEQEERESEYIQSQNPANSNRKSRKIQAVRGCTIVDLSAFVERNPATP